MNNYQIAGTAQEQSSSLIGSNSPRTVCVYIKLNLSIFWTLIKAACYMPMMSHRIGAYLRVSTIEQQTDMQRQEMSEYLDARGFSKRSFYEDIGHSGTTACRPQLQKLLRDVRERRVDVVVVWKLDRLFRSLKHVVVTLNEFEELGVGFISVKDQIDLKSASGRLMLHLLGAFGEFEAALIRERVIAGMRNAKRKGKRIGRPRSLNRATIRNLRAQGLSLSQIARKVGATKGAISKVLKGFQSPLIEPAASV